MAFVYKNKNGDISRNRINLVTDVFDEKGGIITQLLFLLSSQLEKMGDLILIKILLSLARKILIIKLIMP